VFEKRLVPLKAHMCLEQRTWKWGGWWDLEDSSVCGPALLGTCEHDEPAKWDEFGFKETEQRRSL
jgi:hypothetical protein